MEITGTFFFDPADRIYRDHFPAHPVVPGTQIVRAFMEAIRRAMPTANRLAIDHFRFRQFVVPGEYAYRIQSGEKGLACEMFDQDRIVATGRMVAS
jgi:3-hydroxyacyl-[acyl-carrier-protein] dehydratase